MTELQRQRALALAKCKVQPSSIDRDFIRDLVCAICNRWPLPMTPARDRYLARLAWKYRGRLRELGHAALVPKERPEG